MSIAGIRSNRGDIYQKLIAFEWAVTVLADPDFLWVETDSVSHNIDDIVIGKADGTLICCQCKKNQPDFRSWSLADLEDELKKAVQEISIDPTAKINFYSRSDFGDLAKLKEFSEAFLMEANYQSALTKGHSKTDKELRAFLKQCTSSVTSSFEFIKHIEFEVTPSFERLEIKLQERLNYLASNSKVAYNALWLQIDKLGGRSSSDKSAALTKHRLTKEELKNILRESGAILAPQISKHDVLQSFKKTSVIGRSWVRDIGGERIQRPIVEELLEAIDDEKQAILLTGNPGSGKTCVMLSLQEALEQRANTKKDLVPLFIQSREFADLATLQERETQGLPEKWVEQAARLAEDSRVVVVIDSLDVLSIAREHSVLTYFLAQIDQLLLIPNVTVVTACRDFDYKYDRRISMREWDIELKCKSLDWDEEIEPLLEKLGIDTNTIGTVTRELVRNSRELALFVELAQRGSCFNVVTSQALGQLYLDIIVQSDPELSDVAMQAIEEIASEMLNSRSLSISQQRFKGSQEILRRLLSLNVLQKTHDGRLTFGHQTLLDILVISGVIRQGISLNEFIQNLPPVPFVRPTIRSFVTQLMTGERKELRKQLWAVLTGESAFHIRRLVAESYSQLAPDDNDWSLIRNLRDNHRDVYQVIYTQASRIEWHYFWLKNLAPLLKENQDSDGLFAHINRISIWINSDPKSVITLWDDIISLDWMDKKRIADQIEYSLSNLNEENLLHALTLVEKLVKIPKSDHSSLGVTVARCVTAGIISDDLLWNYIAGDITKEDMARYNFNDKLRCKPREFGNENDDFLKQRMIESTELLDLAIDAIEQWSQHKYVNYYSDSNKNYWHGFLSDTSYDDIHSQGDRYVSDERLLFAAIEAGILHHGASESSWWRKNRKRICLNPEGALCYIGIKTITNFPQSNLHLIGKVLTDKDLLEFELSYELAKLIQSAFILLNENIQDSVIEAIKTIWAERKEDEENRPWIIRRRAEYISAVPLFLRLPEVDEFLNCFEEKNGKVILEPSIRSRGGFVAPPFSYEVFLNVSDIGVIRLLKHYTGHTRDFDDYLVGGEQEVGMQLSEASSRHPLRFLRLLVSYWTDISENFRNTLIEGVATYLLYRYGNLKTDASWKPVEEPIDDHILVDQLLYELTRHVNYWRNTRSMAKVLNACAYLIQDQKDAERLLFHSISFGYLEASTEYDDPKDLINTGINMKEGNVAEALMILANRFIEKEILFPHLLAPLLRIFSANKHPAIRALILYKLPYLQSKDAVLGWKIFNLAMQKSQGLWQVAEKCLYYSYYNDYGRIAPLLDIIYKEGNETDLETWGRISALCVLAGHIENEVFLKDLHSLGITEAWKGAASVWTHEENFHQHRQLCLIGFEEGLNSENNHSMVVAQSISKMFRHNSPYCAIPPNIIRFIFDVFEQKKDDGFHPTHGFSEWLNATSQRDPDSALNSAEIYLGYVSRVKPYFYDYKDQLVQLLTRLFKEAEEREEFDKGEMLQRVVSLQDLLLSLGLNSMNEWIQAAERQ